MAIQGKAFSTTDDRVDHREFPMIIGNDSLAGVIAAKCIGGIWAKLQAIAAKCIGGIWAKLQAIAASGRGKT